MTNPTWQPKDFDPALIVRIHGDIRQVVAATVTYLGDNRDRLMAEPLFYDPANRMPAAGLPFRHDPDQDRWVADFPTNIDNVCGLYPPGHPYALNVEWMARQDELQALLDEIGTISVTGNPAGAHDAAAKLVSAAAALAKVADASRKADLV